MERLSSATLMYIPSKMTVSVTVALREAAGAARARSAGRLQAARSGAPYLLKR